MWGSSSYAGQCGVNSHHRVKTLLPVCIHILCSFRQLVARLTLDDRGFPVAASRAWNSLLASLHDATSLSIFRQELKTFLFRTNFEHQPPKLALLLLFVGVAASWHLFTFVKCPCNILTLMWTVWPAIPKLYANLHTGWVYNHTGYDVTI